MIGWSKMNEWLLDMIPNQMLLDVSVLPQNIGKDTTKIRF